MAEKKSVIILFWMIPVILLIIGLCFGISKYSEFIFDGFAFTEDAKLRNLGKQNIEEYLNEKYGLENIKFKKVFIGTDRNFSSPIPIYSEVINSGWIYAEVKTKNGETIKVINYTDYVENNNVQTKSICYDDYQIDEIKKDLLNLIEDVVPKLAYWQNVKIYNGRLSTIFAYDEEIRDIDISYLINSKYNGDIRKFLVEKDDDTKLSVTEYYLNAESLNISDESKKIFEGLDLNITLENYTAENVIKERIESDATKNRYYPYLIDSYVKSSKKDDENIYYRPELKSTKEGIKYTTSEKDIAFLDIESFIVEPNIDFDKKMENWIPQYEYDDTNASTNKPIKEYKVKRVSDYFANSKEYDMYVPTSLIENYNPNKTYKVCSYNEEHSGVYEDYNMGYDMVYNNRYATPYEIRCVNNEYIYERASNSTGVWFIVEVEEIKL